MLLPREQAARVWLNGSHLDAFLPRSLSMPELNTKRTSPCFVTRVRAVPSATHFLSKLLPHNRAIPFGSARQTLTPPRIGSLNHTPANSCLSVYFRATHPYRPAMLITVVLSFRAITPRELELPSGLARLARRLATTSCIERRRRAFVGLPFDRRSSLPVPTSRASREPPCHHETIPTAVRSVGVP